KCTSHLPKFSFNSQTGQCQQLAYNGCLGNLNNFDTAEECQNTCGKYPSNQPS
ncbi:predicted protein, partial [Nematostella vectensis]